MANLRWKEPWGGGMIPDDTGLCNRIFHWELAYGINKANDFDFDILVEERFFPELKYLNFPNTSWFRKEESLDLNYNTIDDKFWRGYTPITYDMMKKMSADKNYKLDTTKDYYADFGFDFIDEFSTFVEETPILIDRPLQKITIKNKFLDERIKKVTDKVVGVHIRRFPVGTYRDENDEANLRNGEPIDWDVDHDEILKPADGQTKKDRQKELHGLVKNDGKVRMNFAGDKEGYTVINDSAYFACMDKIVELNPSQKFYISTDIPKSNLKKFYDRYDIVDYDYVINGDNRLSRYFSRNKDFDSPKGFHRHAFKNVVDLFSLSNCYFLFKFGQSTWSTFAQDYNKIPGVHPEEHFKYTDKSCELRFSGTLYDFVDVL